MEDWARLQPRDVPLQWHEAVAIVRDVAEAIATGQIRAVPASTALAVDASGIVHLLQSGAAAGGRVDQAELVAGLRRLLGELLPSSGSPQELLQLIAGDPAASTASVGEFNSALAFFERPSRQRDLAALAARLREVQEQHRLEAELESLTRKARTEAPEPGLPKPDVQQRAVKRSRIRPALLLGAVAVIAVLASAGLLIARATSSGDSASGNSVADTATKQARTLLNKVRETATSMFGAPAKAAAPERADAAAVTTGKRSRPARNPAPRRAASLTPPVAAIQQAAVRIPMEPPLAMPVPQPYVTAWDAPMGGPVTEDIYDRANGEVVPAMLLRPHLPTVSPADAARRGLSVLEAVISPDGQVERVRLVRTTPDRRYYDIMLLAAVKAWVFQPAIRNGFPVRYRVQIPLT